MCVSAGVCSSCKEQRADTDDSEPGEYETAVLTTKPAALTAKVISSSHFQKVQSPINYSF